MKIHRWIVDNKHPHDDQMTLELVMEMSATSPTAAWRKFLSLVSTSKHEWDRSKWNKLGYVARRVTITIEFEEK